MDLKKRSLKTQKSKKNFQIPKCFQLSGLTKTLFSCKTTRNPNQDNYVIMDFTHKTTSTDIPLTSTMIEQLDSTKTYPQNRLNINDGKNLNEYYALYPDYNSQQNFANFHTDIEESRKYTPPVSSMTTYISDYDEVTIVNNDKSPISNRLVKHEESFDDYLHSTKLSHENLCSSLLTDNLSPLHPNKQSTMLHSPISSPVQSSKINPSISNNYLEASKDLESLIFGLSSIYEEDNNTKICTEHYDATFVDDVTVQYADTLTILKDDNDDWLYVEINSDKRRGFIPKNIVSDLKDFIFQLKIRQNIISNSTIFN